MREKAMSNDGPRWIKHWQFKFLSGIYRAQHEHDVEQARRYAELRKSGGTEAHEL